MARPCSICQHAERAMIEQELFRNGVPLRNVAKRVGASPTSLHRHKAHVPVEVQKALRGEKLTADLAPRKQRYLEGLVAGKSKRAAALAAGYSESMAAHANTKIETPDVKAIFARLVREAVPPELIAETLKAGMKATETKFFAHEGVVQDQRDVINWTERRQYAALAAEYGGYATRDSKEERGSGGGVILLFGDPPKFEPENRTIEQAVEENGPILLLDEPEENNG